MRKARFRAPVPASERPESSSGDIPFLAEATMQYRLLTAASAAELDAVVNELLKLGWMLYEGPLMCAAPPTPTTSSESHGMHFAQAMTLSSPTPAAEAQEEVGELLERIGVSEFSALNPPASV
jgi:hypothetical protein